MKMKIIGTALFVLLFTGIGYAQDFQGRATYKSKRQMNIQFDSTQVNSEMQKQMMAMMKKQFERTYILSFNKEASIYKQEESLESPQPSAGGIQIIIAGSGEADILYKNTKEERYVNQNEMFGKSFLIKDKLEKLDWIMGSETKNIGEYTCYKATMKREVEAHRIRINEEDSDDDVELEMEEITITAWYTPQIPVNNGPGNYYGLPGLILEVNDGSETVICSKIVMNPKEKSEIKEPTKGKEVTQEEYDAVLEKKMEEMESHHENDRRGDGHSMSIRIGG